MTHATPAPPQPTALSAPHPSHLPDPEPLAHHPLELALAVSGTGLWDWHIPTGHAEFSAGWKQMLGFHADEPAPNPEAFVAMMHPDDRALVEERIQAHLRERQPFEVEFRLRTKDHKWLWVLSRGMVVEWDEQQQPIRMVGTHTDVTARVRAEQAERQTRARLEDALECLDSGLIMYDRQLRLIICNQKYRDMYPEAAPILCQPGATALDVLRIFCDNGGNQSSGMSAEAWIIWRLERLRHGGAPVERQLNSGRWVRSSDRLTSDGGVVSLHTDITLIKEAEQQALRAGAAAEAANRAKSNFLANMSHEIRTPMNGIIGMTELALGTALSEEQHEYLSLVKSSAQSLMGIINDILDFSKIESGKLTLEDIPFRLHDLIRDTLKPLMFDAQNKGVAVLQNVSPDIPAQVVGDPNRLRQVLTNLVGNALKFTERGQISVEVQALEHSAGHVTLHWSVKDSGIGISHDKQAHIFESFAQADASTSRRYGGTGLGLTICQRLVRLMGGDIGVQSMPGVGSTFWFTTRFNLTSSALPEPPSHRASSGPARHARILVVEDNLVNQRLAMRWLEKLGYQAMLARTGLEAIELASSGQFDLILMDVQLPEMDGLEATRRIRAATDITLAHIPIIAMTAHAMNEDRARGLEAGMTDYLTKPLQPEALQGMLVRHLPDAGQPDAGWEQRILNRYSHDMDLLADIVAALDSELPGLFAQVEQGLTQRHRQQIRAAAHAMHGSLTNFCWDDVQTLAAELEHLAAQEADPALLQTTYQQLRQAVDARLPRLHRLTGRAG